MPEKRQRGPAKPKAKPKATPNYRSGVLTSYRPKSTAVDAIRGVDPKNDRQVADLVHTLTSARIISGYSRSDDAVTLQVVGQRAVRLTRGDWLVVEDGKVSKRSHESFSAAFDVSAGEVDVAAYAERDRSDGDAPVTGLDGQVTVSPVVTT